MANYRGRNGSDPVEEKLAIKSLSELVAQGNPEIEIIDDMSSVELEAFMNEKVTIYMHPPRIDGELGVQTISVNGVNQPIVKGKKMEVKRKYVESIARTHTIRYQQAVPDVNRPDFIQMVERKIPTYPFSVIEDTDKGKAWLNSICESL